MSSTRNIEWTNATWNPVRGCTRIGPGCNHCYAQTFAERWRGIPGHPFEQGFDLRLVPEKLADPFRWSVPKKFFVNSMSDLFHDGVPDAYIKKACDIMMAADWHTYQVLTKRPQRMGEMLQDPLAAAAAADHILWGVSVEDRKHGVPRIDMLRRTGAKKRLLSIEPLLEDLGEIELTGISWVIVGGESGPGERGMEEGWVRSIRHQCRAANVPLFFKQWGGVQKKRTGRLLDDRTYDEFPVIETGNIPSLAYRRELLAQSLHV